MKKIALVGLVLVLSGCAQIKMMLVKHDPVLANHFVQTRVSLETADCSIKDTLKPSLSSSHLMAKYAEFRNDPQKDSAIGVHNNVGKAIATKDEAACKRWLSLANQRMQVLNKAWSDR